MNPSRRTLLGQAIAAPLASVLATPLIAPLALMAPGTARAAPLVLEGYPVEDNQTVAGTKLTINGAGVRKRGFFKTEVGALYLSSKCQTFDEVFHASGPKRIRLVMLKDVPPAVATRYFLTDFRLSATDEEYTSLVNEVAAMGRAYGNLSKITKGDVVDVDWIPGVGFAPLMNGRELLESPIRSERFFKVVLRNYVDSGAPADYRKALLGLT